MTAQHAFAVKLGQTLGLDSNNTPLFPCADGSRTGKQAAVATIVELAKRVGQPTVCPASGGQLLGGHSMRTGGAQALAGLGVDPIRIQTMGRWKSDLVIRYSGARGACGITHDTSGDCTTPPRRLPIPGLPREWPLVLLAD